MSELKLDIKEISNNLDVLKQLKDAADYLSKNEALVGVPEENSGRKGAVTNAELAYIHTNGSPARGIPARPIIEPAIEKNKEEIAVYLREASKEAAVGNLSGAQAGLKKAGMAGQNAVRARFTDNDWVENDPATIRQKGSSSPLIDTGSLKGSITYVIREKGR